MFLMHEGSHIPVVDPTAADGIFSLAWLVIALFVMLVAAAEVVVGLAIIMTIFRTRRSASVDDANLLKY